MVSSSSGGIKTQTVDFFLLAMSILGIEKRLILTSTGQGTAGNAASSNYPDPGRYELGMQPHCRGDCGVPGLLPGTQHSKIERNINDGKFGLTGVRMWI